MIIETGKEIVLSVSEYIERLNIALGAEAGYVEGEVIGFKASPQWVFFSLKDAEVSGGGAVLSCGLLAHEFRRMGVQVEDGMRVKIFGNPRITPKSGRFGMWVKSIEPVGEGSLKKAYDLLVKKLKDEGLFTRKRELPEFITRIAVISSREGVVIQDLRKNLRRLNLRISFMHTPVEGATAVSGILRALEYFTKNASKYDVLVVIRGGGLLESMQAFNNEEVARALYACPIPVIAGIGHDVDVPIAALVADAMASTPTGVAHIINETWSALTNELPMITRDILDAQNIAIYRYVQSLSMYTQKIAGYFQNIFRSFDNLASKFARSVDRLGEYLRLTKTRVISIENMLKLADPARNLRLGYSITRSSVGKVLRSKKDAKIGDTITTRLADGELDSKII
ncbi:MAG TPA: exodeoxyribonuclease VII large subunit [Candidatus Paceibacterota bacterium]